VQTKNIQMPIYNTKKLDSIIKHYKANSRKREDKHIEFCIGQNSLADAINVAAKAVDENNKIHFHQRRVGRTELDTFAESLVSFENEIEKAISFDDIFEITKKAKTEGINELAQFDTALRIGNFLKMLPQKVYLTSSTRTGAENLLGHLFDKTSLTIEDFPTPFNRPDLSTTEIEDILHIYKDELEFCVK
jgi:hypothetical protein